MPGARLFYLDAGGSGPALLLLHAGTGSARVWEHQWAPLGAAGYRVIAYDRRGYGRTTIDPDGPPGTAADDLKALTDAARPRSLSPRRHRRWRHRGHRLRAGLPRSAAQSRGRQQSRRGDRPVVRRARPAAASQGVRRPAARSARARSRVSGRRSRGHRSLAGAGAPQSRAGHRPAGHSRPSMRSRSRCSRACASRPCC